MPQLNKIRSTRAVALLGALLAVVAPSPVEAAQPINIVAIAAASDGQGYVMAESDGVVWAYGSVGHHGDLRAQSLNQSIVGIEVTPSGRGYWLVASDGGVFAFGDADFFGSTGALRLNEPIISLHSTPSGRGYRLFARDGGEFDFGDADFIASVANRGVRFSAALQRPRGDGHWFVTASSGAAAATRRCRSFLRNGRCFR
ncbi:MAG: hypothetical protein ACI8Y4_002602 [Candidatus Poriferisodalaceae bacterium]|jgi:hypothetical protein